MCTDQNNKKGITKSFDFSKASDRKKVLYGVYGSATSKDLFGVNMKKVTDDTGKYYGKYYADTGDVEFSYSKVKYQSTGNNAYKITQNLHYKLYEDGEPAKSGNIGAVTFRVKKNSGSKYGFVMKKMSIRRTSNANPWG